MATVSTSTTAAGGADGVAGADMARFREAFRAVDTTGTGHIPARSLPEALRLAGREGALGHDAAALGDDAIDFDYFVRLATLAAAAPPRAPTSPGGGPAYTTGSTATASAAPRSSPSSGARPSVTAVFADATVPSAADVAASALALEEGPDLRVMEFLRVLDEYRVKCEAEANYTEAGKAADQLASIRKQEESRRMRSVVSRHAREKDEVALAHARQYAEFNEAWDRYLAEFDAMAGMYVSNMQERHGAKLKEYQEHLHEEVTHKAAPFSRELLEWRTREHSLAKQRKYADAQRVKVLADEMERRERRKVEEARAIAAAGREAKFKEKQAQELAALVKRIEARRAEHVKQREQDTRRLLQRNRNVMAVLEQRHLQEEQRHLSVVRLDLHPHKAMSPRMPSSLMAGMHSMKLDDASAPRLSSPPSGGGGAKVPSSKATSPRAAAVSPRATTSPRSAAAGVPVSRLNARLGLGTSSPSSKPATAATSPAATTGASDAGVGTGSTGATVDVSAGAGGGEGGAKASASSPVKFMTVPAPIIVGR